MDWNDVAVHLSGLANLATATPDGAPHVSVVMPVVDGEQLWVFTNASSATARRIAANPRVALMWRPRAEAYVWGEAELVDDLATKQVMWARSDLPFDPAMFFGTADNPDHVLARITPTRATVMTDDGTGPRAHRWHR